MDVLLGRQCDAADASIFYFRVKSHAGPDGTVVGDQ